MITPVGASRNLASASRSSSRPARTNVAGSDGSVRLQELAQERASLTALGETARKQVASLTHQQEELSQRLAALPPPLDSTNLELAVRRAQQQGDLAQRLTAAREQLQAAEQQAEIELRRLPLWTGDLAALEGWNQGFGIRMNSSSSIPLGRFHQCAILALRAQAAKANADADAKAARKAARDAKKAQREGNGEGAQA